MLKLFRLVPILLALLAQARPASAADVVRLGNLRFVQYGGASYMQQIAHKYGLVIEEKFFDKGIDAMEALKNGQVDLAACATDAAIAGYANGAPLYIVAGLGKGGATLIARKESGITTTEGLKGKKVAVLKGAVQELLLYAELVQHKMTWSTSPGQDVLVIQTKTAADANKMLTDGSVDAVLAAEPFATQAVSKGVAVLVTKPYDTPLGEPVRSLVMSKAMYERRDVALRVLRCFVEATQTLIANADLAEMYVRDHVFAGKLSHDDYVASATSGPLTTDITSDYVQKTAYYMVKYGAGKLAIRPVAADFVRLDLLEEAKRAAAK